MNLISIIKKNYMFSQTTKKILHLSSCLLFLALLNANKSIGTTKESFVNSNEPNKKITPNSQTTIESKFTEAFFKHTRPYHFDNDISAKIRNLLTISTGGTNRTTFIGVGFREKSIEWDGLAIENTYKEVMEFYYPKFKFNGADIESIFRTSLSSESKKFD